LFENVSQGYNVANEFLSRWLTGALSRAGVKNMERQTARLKRLQIERKTRGRHDDDFMVA
jgi:hypothetical protein